MSGVDLRFGLVIRLPAHGPREVLRVVPLGRAGCHVQLRHLAQVHVLVDGGIRRRAERLEQEQHLVLLDQLARHLDRLGRAVAVVVADEGQLAAVDAALIVHHPEIGVDGLADRAVRRRRAAVGVGVADLDLGVGCARVVLLLGGGRKGERCQHRSDANELGFHGALLLVKSSRMAPATPVGIRYTKPIMNTPKIAQGAAFEISSAMFGMNWMNSAP